jgi:hypothetical protein
VVSPVIPIFTPETPLVPPSIMTDPVSKPLAYMIFVVGVILSSKDSNSGLNENKVDGFLLFLTSAPFNNLKNLFNINISPVNKTIYEITEQSLRIT